MPKQPDMFDPLVPDTFLAHSWHTPGREGTSTWEDLNLDDIDIRLKFAGMFHRGKRTPQRFMMRLKVGVCGVGGGVRACARGGMGGGSAGGGAGPCTGATPVGQGRRGATAGPSNGRAPSDQTADLPNSLANGAAPRSCPTVR